MEEAQPQIHVSADVGKVSAAAAKPQDNADEPVSDTDEECEGGRKSLGLLIVLFLWSCLVLFSPMHSSRIHHEKTLTLVIGNRCLV